MYKAIRELRRFQTLPPQKKRRASTEVPECKEFYGFVDGELCRVAVDRLKVQDLGGKIGCGAARRRVFLLILLFPQCLH